MYESTFTLSVPLPTPHHAPLPAPADPLPAADADHEAEARLILDEARAEAQWLQRSGVEATLRRVRQAHRLRLIEETQAHRIEDHDTMASWVKANLGISARALRAWRAISPIDESALGEANLNLSELTIVGQAPAWQHAALCAGCKARDPKPSWAKRLRAAVTAGKRTVVAGGTQEEALAAVTAMLQRKRAPRQGSRRERLALKAARLVTRTMKLLREIYLSDAPLARAMQRVLREIVEGLLWLPHDPLLAGQPQARAALLKELQEFLALLRQELPAEPPAAGENRGSMLPNALEPKDSRALQET